MRKGSKASEETRKKLSEIRKGKLVGEKNGRWKGDNVGYFALHDWLRKHFIKPKTCMYCQNEHPVIDLANITGIYNRNFNNWKWLCRRCHLKSDGRMENLLNHPKDPKTGRFIKST